MLTLLDIVWIALAVLIANAGVVCVAIEYYYRRWRAHGISKNRNAV